MSARFRSRLPRKIGTSQRVATKGHCFAAIRGALRPRTSKARKDIMVIRKITQIYSRRKQLRAWRALYRKYADYTMIPEGIFVQNLELAARVRKLPGTVVECGVWRGGMIAAIAELLGAER